MSSSTCGRLDGRGQKKGLLRGRGLLLAAVGGLTPESPGGRRGFQWTGAPRSATALAASRASWLPPSSGRSARCSVFWARPEAPARRTGPPGPRPIRSLPLASAAATRAAPGASPGPGRAAGACDHPCRPPEVSGPQAGAGRAATPRRARPLPRRGPRCCSGSGRARTWPLAAPLARRHPLECGGCCRPATPERARCRAPPWPPSESCE